MMTCNLAKMPIARFHAIGNRNPLMTTSIRIRTMPTTRKCGRSNLVTRTLNTRGPTRNDEIPWWHRHDASIVSSSVKDSSSLTPLILNPSQPSLGSALYLPVFTPVECGLAGLVLGSSAILKFVHTGRILGISGTLRGLVDGKNEPWRLAFLAGLLTIGAFANALSPTALDVIPATYTVARAVVGGLLVGFGAALGNGCTSGHGICGNARLSLRSFVFTVMMMVAGAVSATLSQTAVAMGVVQKSYSLWMPRVADVASHLNLLLVTGLSIVVLTVAARMLPEAAKEARRNLALVVEFASGGLFAAGLALSGMTRPSKVASFLTLSASFDPSLLFVMGGAIAISAPLFHLLYNEKIKFDQRPLCDPETEFCSVPPPEVTKSLVLGGVLFGVGWGLGGICPGPGLVNLAATPLQPQILAFNASMLGGMALWKVVKGQKKLAAALEM